MLSRVAESLYWVGRYVERAEDTARLLDVHVHALLQDPWVDETAACRDLLAVMGQRDGEPTVPAVTDLLAFKTGGTSSIVGALTAARESARGVREALSSELWECLNATYHALPARTAAVKLSGPHPFFRYVRERGALVSGYLDTTMPRDDGWRFLVLGRSLERVDMTARLLWAQVGRGGGPGWVGLLKSCSAHEAYLRTYRAAVEPDRVVEFLVLDRLFPRSLYAALVQAERCLDELSPETGRTGVDDPARRMLGRARTQLEYQVTADLLVDLPDLLDLLQRTCAATGDAVAARYFSRASGLAWQTEVEA